MVSQRHVLAYPRATCLQRNTTVHHFAGDNGECTRLATTVATRAVPSTHNESAMEAANTGAGGERSRARMRVVSSSSETCRAETTQS